jgi:hypothetical protein
MEKISCFILLLCLFIKISNGLVNVLAVRAGLVTPASAEETEYYEKFKLDYGCNDFIRSAGSLCGVIKAKSLSSLPEVDPFLKWLNEKLERGAGTPLSRVKPFYV